MGGVLSIIRVGVGMATLTLRLLAHRIAGGMSWSLLRLAARLPPVDRLAGLRYFAPVNDVVAVILGGGRGTRLYPLTQLRSKPGVPLAGKYRLIVIAAGTVI